MSLIASMNFFDDDPNIHAHMSQRANELLESDPAEWVRILHTLEEALTAYAGAVRRHRERVEIAVALEEEALAAREIR